MNTTPQCEGRVYTKEEQKGIKATGHYPFGKRCKRQSKILIGYAFFCRQHAKAINKEKEVRQ